MSEYPHRGHWPSVPNQIELHPGCELSIQQLVTVARGDEQRQYARVVLTGDWRDRCRRSADYVRHAVESTMGKSTAELAEISRRLNPRAAEFDEADLARRALIYGVTTGFGYFKSRPLASVESASQMQINILRSHATGVGPPMPTDVVRAMMLLRIRTFIEGHSGVRQEVVELLCDLLNRRVHPWVPEQGSVGSSGDLCPLSHLSLILIGEGLAWFDGADDRSLRQSAHGKDCDRAQVHVQMDRRSAPRDAKVVLAEAGLADRAMRSLAPKEGLALSNGTSATTAYAVLAVFDASALLGTANVVASLTLQALCGSTRAFDPKVQAIRRHASQAETARQVLALVEGSRLVNSSADVQDAYSVRCVPAVHGAACHAIEHVWETIEGEINAVTDNPLFFDGAADGAPCDGYVGCAWDAYAAGNFHGEPVGMVADYLKIAVAELANISERRTQAMLDENHNRGLPANLWPEPSTAGANSGLMIAQYSAASLVSENKTLAHPASVDSIPTSSNVEDHVAMATIAARHARRVNDNTRHVLAIELLAALQALELRLQQMGVSAEVGLSPSARNLLNIVRSGSKEIAPVPSLGTSDRELWRDMVNLARLIESGSAVKFIGNS